MQNWISVKDRLPDNEHWVLCAKAGDFTFIYPFWYSLKGKQWHEYGSPNREDRITHWMPLPDEPDISTP